MPLSDEERGYLRIHGFTIDEPGNVARGHRSGRHVWLRHPQWDANRWLLDGGNDNSHYEYNDRLGSIAPGIDDFFASHLLVPPAWAEARLGALPATAWLDPALRYRRKDAPTVLLRSRLAGSPGRLLWTRHRLRASSLPTMTWPEVRAAALDDLRDAGLAAVALPWMERRIDNYFDPLLRNLASGPPADWMARLRLREGGEFEPLTRRPDDALLRSLGASEDFIRFHADFGGGSVRTSAGALELWRTDELEELNDDQTTPELPGALFIGTDGGDRVYLIDTRGEFGSRGAVLVVEAGVMDRAGLEPVAPDFGAFIDRLLDGAAAPTSPPPEGPPVDLAGIGRSAYAWYPNPPATTEEVDAVTRSIPAGAVADLVRAIWSVADGVRGGEGDVELTLWPARILLALRDDSEWSAALPGMLVVGSDGGDRLVVVDLGTGGVGCVDGARVGIDAPVPIASDLRALLTGVRAGDPEWYARRGVVRIPPGRAPA